MRGEWVLWVMLWRPALEAVMGDSDVTTRWSCCYFGRAVHYRQTLWQVNARGLFLSLFISSDVVPRISVSWCAGGVGGGVWIGGGLLSSHPSSGCLLPNVRTESPDPPLGFHTGPDFAHRLPYLPPQAGESSSLPQNSSSVLHSIVHVVFTGNKSSGCCFS